jgi:hypothetical protein
MSSTQNSFVDSVVAAARENPVAAALIGGGALWLLMGSDNLKRAASSAAAATAFPSTNTSVPRPQSSRSEYVASPAPPTAPDMDHEGSFVLGESLRQAGNSASEAVSNASDAIKGRFDEGAAYARDNFNKIGEVLPGKAAISSSLSDLLERQPLVLGAVGLVIGASVASAFRSLDLENEMVGKYSDSVKEDLTERAGAVSQSLSEAADTLRNEIKEAGAETFEKVKKAGKDAAQAAGQKVNTS